MKIKLFFLFLFMVLSAELRAQGTQTAPASWEKDTVIIGKIRQVIATKGLINAPLILFLHGGPGSSRMRQADVFTEELQKHFLVVQWDQRETGMTLALNKTEGPVSLDLMASDNRELIDYLLKKYAKKKLYLAGESWGNVPGFKMVESYPEKLEGYLAFAPVVDQIRSEQLLLSKLLDDARIKNNTIAEKELLRVKIPFENSDQIYYLRKWWFSYDGHPLADQDTAMVKDYLKTWSDTWLPTWQEAMRRNLLTQLPKVKCPVYFFLGGKDYQTNCEIAKSYYEQLSAVKKKMYWFDDASHDVLVTDAAKVQQIIIDEVLKK